MAIALRRLFLRRNIFPEEELAKMAKLNYPTEGIFWIVIENIFIMIL